MSGPTVQVLGIDPRNKGAALMLCAIQDEVGRRFPDARIGVDLQMASRERLRFGVWGVAPTEWNQGFGRGRVMGEIFGRLRRTRHRLGLLDGRDIDVVLDASGFAYGDFWTPAKFDTQVGRNMARWTGQKTAVVLLPQAWGTFQKPGWSQLAPTLAKADLVYARDRQSLGFLEGAGVSAKLAPDFTNLLAPDLPSAFSDAVGASFLIPNAKVIDGKGMEARDRYLQFLAASADTLQTCGRVHVLIHEGAGDRDLADALNARLAAPLPMVDPGDPLATKALLGTARAVISSRFHGIVSALSGGVPTLACGWSHKYAELMADYGVPELIVDVDDESSWPDRLNAFARAVASDMLRPALRKAAMGEKAKAQAMWDEVAAVMDRARAARKS